MCSATRIRRPRRSPNRRCKAESQYGESFFLNAQRQLGRGWVAEAGYTATLGVNLERIDDVNRFTDGLRPPSEDEAVRVYRETYGSDFQ